MQLIAHRGLSGEAPENTMAAFRRALEAGVSAIELDVHQTLDGELVVAHDDDLRRICGVGEKIGAMRWEDIVRLDAGSWFGEKFRGERIPRLEEVFRLVRGRAQVHVEIKDGSAVYPGIERRVVSLIARLRARSWAVVSSFDHAALFLVRSLDPKLALGYLLGRTSRSRAYREMAELGAESLHLSLRQLRSADVEECRKRNLRLFVYTVDDPRRRRRLESMGVDGVFTNFPNRK